MAIDAFTTLLQLPPGDRANLAIALWESLDDLQREAQFSVKPEDIDELDRRLSEHLANPSSGIPWEEVRLMLLRR